MPRLTSRWTSLLLALSAVVLWSLLARLALEAANMPPLLLVGAALTIAGVLSAPAWWRLRVRWQALALGVYGLFGFHLLLFIALAQAPPLSANLINYLWPLFMVLLAPLFEREQTLSVWHVVAALIGFGGAALAMTAAAPGGGLAAPHPALGYACALASALIWATYSLGSRRMARSRAPFDSAAVGLFCLLSGLCALACHALFESPYVWHVRDGAVLVAIGIGPMGAAFFLWDAALRRGSAASIGALAFLTPVLSTWVLALGHGTPNWRIGVAMLAIIAAAALAQLRLARPQG